MTAADAFPFHVRVDEGGRIVSVGPALERIAPALGIGTDVASVAEVVRRGTLVDVRVRGLAIPLRGEIVRETGGESWLLTPAATRLGELAAAGIRLRDLPAWDAGLDLLIGAAIRDALLDGVLTERDAARAVATALQLAHRYRDDEDSLSG